MKSINLILLLILFIACKSAAQTYSLGKGTIKGIVVNEKMQETVPGANVIIKGTTNGTTTDVNGRFNIRNLPDGNYSIVISFLGYSKKQIDNLIIGENKVVDIGKTALKEEVISLKEVVISPGSYSIMEKAKSTSQMTLSEENIKNMAWAEDVTRAVSRLPGISASDYSSKFAI